MNIGVHVSFSILISTGYMPEYVLLGHIVVLFLYFLRTLHTIFQSSCINLNPYKECNSVLLSLHPFVDIMMLAILTGLR